MSGLARKIYVNDEMRGVFGNTPLLSFSHYRHNGEWEGAPILSRIKQRIRRKLKIEPKDGDPFNISSHCFGTFLGSQTVILSSRDKERIKQICKEEVVRHITDPDRDTFHDAYAIRSLERLGVTNVVPAVQSSNPSCP